MITITLHCDFCKKPIGSADVSENFGWTKDNATENNYRLHHQFVDMRCSACEAEHGTFKQLAEEYIQKTGEDWQKAEAFVFQNPKRIDFDREVVKIAEKIKKAKTKV